MTKEEARKAIKEAYSNSEHTNEIIKTLEQKPYEDVISREDTLKAMIEKIGISNECYLYPAEATLYEVVKNMPPVTPEPKVGHWITTRTFMHDGEYYCDKCSCDSPNNEKWDYCPNCGIKMQKVETEK